MVFWPPASVSLDSCDLVLELENICRPRYFCLLAWRRSTCKELPTGSISRDPSSLFLRHEFSPFSLSHFQARALPRTTMRSRRICGDPGGLRGPPIVDGGGGGEVLPVCDGESDETSSGVTQELGGEPPPKSEGAASMTKDSAGTEWTDEKHRSYLNSMEASFVRELYDQDCFSEHLPNLLPKKRKVLNQTRSTTCGSPFSQFKVLQEGCWQKIKFNDISARSDAVKDKWQLLTNPWIQHFAMTSSSKMHTATPLKFSGRAYWASEKRACCEWNEGVSSSSKINVRQIPADCSQKNKLQNYANITEVSDQNFSEEGKRLADGSQTKKLQKWNPQSSGVDKVMTT